MRSEWAQDKAFMAVAAVAWPDDYAAATRKTPGYGTEYNAKQAARGRLKLRWEGFQYAEQVEAKVSAMKRAVDAMAAKMTRMAEVLRDG
jgi:hypothetical protein